VSARGRRTAEQRDEQQPSEWSGERYVPSHRIFAADAGAHHGRTTAGGVASRHFGCLIVIADNGQRKSFSKAGECPRPYCIDADCSI
jgi:hypothetical protein